MSCWALCGTDLGPRRRPGDQLVPVESAAALAAAMPNASSTYCCPALTTLLTSSMTIAATAAARNTSTENPNAPVDERVLKTVMFTDIVGSTEKAQCPRRRAHWRHQLDAHDKVVDWLLEKYGGHRAKHTGDGTDQGGPLRVGFDLGARHAGYPDSRGRPHR